ncbi:AMP_1a_G0001020.mRNA.1.CDS.1 [Saccharomyces cerevisiae]|nr:AMP_1a_G0001020.mRNA.1.CDS.1 [Saccharomyces cerevisiae]CAI6474759.1 AMP_1a_G0001020.mRNA.1.CDS.1 [Saccharomyces cerevisiae]
MIILALPFFEKKYEYLSLTRKNALFCLAINEPSPIFALTIIAIFSSTNVRSSVVRLGCF